MPTKPSNIALLKPTAQSSTDYGGHSSRAEEGNIKGIFWENSVTHTAPEPEEWWKVDLQQVFSINKIIFNNRVDCCVSRLDGFVATIFEADSEVTHPELHPTRISLLFPMYLGMK